MQKIPEDKLQKALEMYDNGYTYKDITEATGIPRASLRYNVKATGRAIRGQPKFVVGEVERALIKDWNSMVPMKDIQKKYGYSEMYGLYRRVRELKARGLDLIERDGRKERDLYLATPTMPEPIREDEPVEIEKKFYVHRTKDGLGHTVTKVYQDVSAYWI